MSSKLNFTKAKQQVRLAQDRARAPDPRFDHLVDRPAPPIAAPVDQQVKTALTPSAVRTTTMEITPEMAARWLEGNTHNRPLSQKQVEYFSRAMKAGRWVLNGESIIFADDGSLLDGQHRLWAAVESQTSFESVVVFGAPKAAFTTIDQGRARSIADHIKVSGTGAGVNLTSLGAVAADILRYRSNNLFSNEKTVPEEIIALIQAEPEIERWVSAAKRAPAGLSGLATPIAVTLYIGSRSFPAEAEAFLHHWITGSDLSEGNPVLTLRQRMLSAPPSARWQRLFLVVSAWNAFAQKRQLRKMGSMRGDKFPPIMGDNSR